MKQKLLLLIVVSLLMWGCAATKVKVYESLPESRENIVNYAMTQLGKPYKNAAKGPDAFDCSGLVYYVYRHFSVPVPNNTEELDRTGVEIGRGEVMAADLVFFKIKKAYHIGIMINNRQFIHASQSRGVAVDPLDTPYWQRGLLRFRRVL